MSRDVFRFAFAVNRQEPDFILLPLEVINHAHTAAFASARDRPTDFSNAAGAGYDFAGLWVAEQ
jgi:hypothetical protein